MLDAESKTRLVTCLIRMQLNIIEEPQARGGKAKRKRDTWK